MRLFCKSVPGFLLQAQSKTQYIGLASLDAEEDQPVTVEGVTGSPQVDSGELHLENVTSPRTPLEEKLFARIQSDLEPWRNGITREMVEHTYCTVTFRA